MDFRNSDTEFSQPCTAVGAGLDLATSMSRQLRPCPDCGATIGDRHRTGCDIERCHHCRWQAFGCLHFDPNDARRQALNGKWPGEDDCERLDFFVNGDPDFPDLNRLFTDCVWDADTGRWERRRRGYIVTSIRPTTANLAVRRPIVPLFLLHSIGLRDNRQTSRSYGTVAPYSSSSSSDRT